MSVKKHLRLILLTILFIESSQVISQVIEKNNSLAETIKRGVVLKLNDKGSSYFKFGMGVHLWYRNMEMNPNSINKNTELHINNYSDFALRRMRISAMINYESKHIIYTQFGLTSEASYNGLHSGIFFHDLWYKYRVGEKSYLGGGLHMWNGLSRLSNVSYATQLTLDNPGVNFPNVNVSDDFVRQYGVFFQGQLGKFDYSFSINQPLLSSTSKKILNDSEILDKGNYGIAYNRYHSNFSYKGYISYSMFNAESVSTTPFKKMTYYGKKGTFLNIGGGFQYVSDASGILVKEDANITKVVFNKQLSTSVDLWYEKPLINESVINIYSAFYNYEYGSNYLKSGAVMGGFATEDNPNDSPAQGVGINQFTIGTGNVVYLSVSYVIPKNIYNSNKKIMPFVACTYKNFEGLKEEFFQYDFGFHYLIMGDNVKLSTQYSTRPIYSSTSLEVTDVKGLFVLQLQAKF